MKDLSRSILLVMLLLYSLGLSTRIAKAGTGKNAFTPANWSEGFHFFPGAGANTAIFNSKVEGEKIGWGGSVRTDVGYYFRNDFAVELSGSVNFNRVDGLLIWDNLFTFGLRTRLPFVSYSESSAPYVRVFAGRGPLVVVFERTPPPPYKESDAQRLQLEGPAYGTGIGRIEKTPSGDIWFIELMITFHTFERVEVLKSDKDVPFVISQSMVDGKPNLSNLHLLIGIMAF